MLGNLKETTFTSYDTEQMLYASREIKDRARRIGQGTIHAGFQQCSLMDDQQSIYTDLPRLGLDVHMYGIPDTTQPDIKRGQVHAAKTAEIATMWFVVFDGNGDDTQKSALIAEQQDGGTFYGA